MSELLLKQDAGAVRLLTMNRAEKRNALNTALTGAALGGGAGLAIAGDLAVMAPSRR